MIDGIISCLASEAFRGMMLVIAALIAVISILSVFITAQRKQAIDMILSIRQDKQLTDGLALIARLHIAKDDNILKYSEHDMRGHETTVLIQYVLNHYEFVAVGIRQSIYSEQIVKASSYTTIVKLYDRALPFISNVRKANQTPTYYQEFECLAKRWKDKPLKVKKK